MNARGGADPRRVEFGDWQTPLALARAALETAMRGDVPAPATVLEPTCGEGAFLAAAAALFPRARLLGYEKNAAYAERARSILPPERTHLVTADFFTVPWERVLADLPEPILVAGNPPWVTSAALGALGSDNLPAKENVKRLSGLDARTGKSNFDVSEWMLLRLIDALRGRNARVAMLCKSAVARKVIEEGVRRDAITAGGLWRIDAKAHFGAAVDAVLFACTIHKGASASSRWPVYDTLDAAIASSSLAVVDGVTVADGDRLERTAHLAGSCDPEWRSGIKHDCAKVMELERAPEGWKNGLGHLVDIEESLLFPLQKGSDVASLARACEPKKKRALLVPQKTLGEDTRVLERRAPKTWAYLRSHEALLGGRKSSIYRGAPPFSIFGVGPYSFAPHKVAISALHKQCAFSVIGPHEGKPVMLDDTCYFLPFDSAAEADRAVTALRSAIAQDFFAARIFWDAKRPISKAILQQLDLGALLTELKM